VAEVTGSAAVIALGRPWSGEVADRNGDLLDTAFGWTDIARLRGLVTKHCAAAGLAGSRLDDFVLAVHEISANAVVHAGAGGRLVLRRVADGIRCLVADTIPKTPKIAKTPPGGPAPRDGDDGRAISGGPGEPIDGGRGLWLATTLADDLSITSGPVSTIVSLFMRLD
jgi:anti-sigma regulatory factor (Ser/Thr protein kinase)